MSFDELVEWLNNNDYETTTRWWNRGEYSEIAEAIYAVTNYLPSSCRMGTRIDIIEKGHQEQGKCNYCKKPTEWTNGNFRTYCSTYCLNTDPDTVRKRNETTIARYGVVGVSQLPHFKLKMDNTKIAKHGSLKKAEEARMEKTRVTNMERYGVESTFQNEEVKKKINETLLERYGGHHLATEESMSKLRQTNLEKYGVEYQSQRPEMINLIKETNLERYGVESGFFTENAKKGVEEYCLKHGVDHPAKAQYSIEKARQTRYERFGGHHLSVPEIKAKQENTNLLRYGKAHVSQVEDFKIKIRATNIGRYGFEHATMSEQVKEKTRQTNVERYGHESHTQSAGFIENVIRSNLVKYGVEWYMQTQDFKEKSRATNLSLYGSENYMQRNLTDIGHEIKTDEGFIKWYNILGESGLFEASGYSQPNLLVTRAIELKLRTRYRSYEEQEIDDMIQSWGFTTIAQSRNTVKGHEIDIIIPEKNIAIEYCGEYWHSEKFKDNNYHLSKLISCQEQGLSLITLWGSEWKQRRQQVTDRLQSLLGMNAAIGARACSVQTIVSTLAKAFIEEFHIQGAPLAVSKSFGLIHQEELIGVMMFTRRKENDWELTRLAFNTNVMGGPSKLLSAFKKTTEWDTITTFADRRWTNGELYTKMGFEIDKILAPDYSYVKGARLSHKFNHRKENYADKYDISSMTEQEIMREENWLRLYDCGKIRFILKNT